MSINENVRRIRQERNLSQVELSEMLGISLSTYNGYEVGRRKFGAALLYRIAKLFRVPMEVFFE